MTRFNPNKNNKSAAEWSEEAYKFTSQNNLQFHVIGGLALGVMIAGATTPVTGGLVAAYALWSAWKKSGEIQRNQAAILETGCVAQVLDGDNFRDYLDQVGHDAVINELDYAHKRGLAISNDALDYLEDSQYQAPAQQQVLPSVKTARASMSTNVYSTSGQGQPPVITTFDPTASARIDIISEMTDRITNTIVIGVPGSGKGILISNAIREAKKKHPDLKVFVIDPKADPKESGYFDCCDVIEKYACMDAKPSTVAAWAEAAFDKYAEYAQSNARTLLVIDEGTMLGNKLHQAKSGLLIDKLTAYTSGGDSAGRNVFFMMQSPYVSGSSLNLATSSQMLSIVIASSENLGALAQWKSAKMLKSFSLDEVDALTQQSPVNRAFYFGKTAKWYSMQELPNYSSYNRDAREYLPGYEPSINTQDLEDCFNASKEVKEQSILSTLSTSAQKVLEWLKANRANQWVKYKGAERDQSFINLARKHGYTSQEAIFDELITELILIESIDLDESTGAILIL